MLTKYINFLKTGSDKWPMEAFEVLGINLESKEVYENAIKYFDSLVTKYKEIKDE
jgi:oligoendopeptidase F